MASVAEAASEHLLRLARPFRYPDQIRLLDESYPKLFTFQSSIVSRGAPDTSVTVPAKAPKDVELTGMLNVLASMIVATNDPFTAVQFPVPPRIVMLGFSLPPLLLGRENP